MKKDVTALYLTGRALQDFRAIESYSIEKWGLATARKYLDKIEFALSLIKDQPDILRTDNQISNNLSFYRIEKHFLVFSIGKKRIILLAIVHVSRDLPEMINVLLPSFKLEIAQLEGRIGEN